MALGDGSVLREVMKPAPSPVAELGQVSAAFLSLTTLGFIGACTGIAIAGWLYG